MSTRSGILRPRRGKRSTAISKGIILKRGEVFFEVPETGVGTGAGKIVMGDGTSSYEDLPYYTGSGSGSGTVQSVNYNYPDEAGNVDLEVVPYSENLVSPDNIKQTSAYIFRTSGGSADINSGDASLDVIRGNCEIDESDNIIVATPTAFKSIGFNQFNKATMIIPDYTIGSNGSVISAPGKYVCYAHAVGELVAGYVAYEPNGTIERIGWCESIPTTSTTDIIVTADGDYVTSITNDPTTSIIINADEGYICVACSNINNLVIHPRWSGAADEELGEYIEYTINIPTKDIANNNLPTATYGFPSVNEVRDEINFSNGTYTQRVGYYPYSAENLDIVESLGVDYIYDSTYIFYVLSNILVYKITEVSNIYTVNDYGTEEFIGTDAPIYATSLYGQNLRDKLRRDVVTISEQTLSSSEQRQVRTNIDAAKRPTVIDYSAYILLPEAERLAGTWLVTNYPGGGGGGGGASTLTELDDVDITSPVAGQLLVYDSTTEMWVNTTQDVSLNGLSDVSITTPSAGQTLVYDTTSSSWINGKAGDDNITANLETSPAQAAHNIGEYICYNGTVYEVIAAIAINDSLVVNTNIRIPILPEGTVIYVPEEETIAAADVTYSNTASGLTAIEVQSAIDEIANNKISKVSGATSGNFAAFDNTGNVVDSTKSASNFVQASSNVLTDQLIANATAVAFLSTSQVRNIYAGTSDMTAGTTVLSTGDIYIVYE